jgi:hypothetical protein
MIALWIEMIWKEAVVAYLEALFWHSSRGTEEDTKISCVPAETQTQYLRNKSQTEVAWQ